MLKRMPQITNCPKPLQSMRWLSALILLFLASCAPNPPARNRDAMLPEVDILQLKENGDVALKLAQQNRVSIEDLNLRVSALERSVARLEIQVQSMPLAQMEEMQNQLTVLREELNVMHKSLSERSAVVPTFNPQHRRAVPEVEAPAPEDYRNGLAAYQAKKYSEAISYFDAMLVKIPESPWADDAWYWIGECYLALGDYERAISAYQKVMSFANSDKSDDAQFRIAGCYYKIGDRNRAVTEYQKIEVLFPQSEYVTKSRSELQKLQSH